jgi:hypothetical protein
MPFRTEDHDKFDAVKIKPDFSRPDRGRPAPHAHDDELTEQEWAQLRNHLRRIDGSMVRTSANLDSFFDRDETDRGNGDDISELMPHLEAFRRGQERLHMSLSQIARMLQRHAAMQANPGAQHLKRRLPKICKTMTFPGEGAELLGRAVVAYRTGGDAGLRRFAAAERAAGRLE